MVRELAPLPIVFLPVSLLLVMQLAGVDQT